MLYFLFISNKSHYHVLSDLLIVFTNILSVSQKILKKIIFIMVFQENNLKNITRDQLYFQSYLYFYIMYLSEIFLIAFQYLNHSYIKIY
jgi:hypothetical protein